MVFLLRIGSGSRFRDWRNLRRIPRSEHLELGELADRLGKRAQFEVGQEELPRTVFLSLHDAVEGYRVAPLFKPFKRPLWHTFVFSL